MLSAEFKTYAQAAFTLWGGVALICVRSFSGLVC